MWLKYPQLNIKLQYVHFNCFSALQCTNLHTPSGGLAVEQKGRDVRSGGTLQLGRLLRFAMEPETIGYYGASTQTTAIPL